jgi:hypothetical protein
LNEALRQTCYFKRPPDKLGPEQIRKYTAELGRSAHSVSRRLGGYFKRPFGGAEHALRYLGL